MKVNLSMKTTPSPENDGDKKFREGVASGIIFVVFMAIVLVINAVTLSLLWKWFVVPQFDVREMSFVISCGFMLLANFLLKGVLAIQMDGVKHERSGQIVGNNLIITILLLFCGWVLHYFV